MATNRGAYLTTNEYLVDEDYLATGSRLFFAILQKDGNLCVQRGTPEEPHGALWCAMKKPDTGQHFAILQEDGNLCIQKGTPKDPKGALWCAMKKPDTGQHYVILKNDGNLCICKGKDPSDYHEDWWCSAKTDPIDDIEIIDIDYDLKKAEIIKTGFDDFYSQIVSNKSTENQTSTVSGSESITETSGWSDTLGVKVGVSTKFKTGLPFIAEGEIEVSAEITNEYTWNGSIERSKTWAFETPVVVPPNQAVNVIIGVSRSTLKVPYILKGIAILKSKFRMPIQVNGLYTGTSTYDLEVIITQQNPTTYAIESTTKKIANIAK